MAEYRRGQGPNALPQGAAKKLNVRTPPAGAYQDMDIPIEFAPDTQPDVDEDDSHYDENMQVLLSPPDPGYRRAVMPRDRPNRVPRYVVRNLPVLMAASRDPSAPPALRALYKATLRQLEMERRMGR